MLFALQRQSKLYQILMMRAKRKKGFFKSQTCVLHFQKNPVATLQLWDLASSNDVEVFLIINYEFVSQQHFNFQHNFHRSVQF